MRNTSCCHSMEIITLRLPSMFHILIRCIGIYRFLSIQYFLLGRLSAILEEFLLPVSQSNIQTQVFVDNQKALLLSNIIILEYIFTINNNM